MTGNKSDRELKRECRRRSVGQSLTVWSALKNAIEKDKTLADIVAGA